MKFQSIFASVLSVACAFCVHTSFADYTASEGDQGEINVDGTLTVSSTIDLQGQSVTYKGVTAFSGTGSFTNGTDKDQSVLKIDVGSSSALKCQFNVKGNIRLIKGGSGSFYFNLNNNSYTGGTEIEAGKLYTDKYANVGGTAASSTSFGAAPQIHVAEGAEIDFGGAPGYNFATVILNGGSITGPNRTMNSTKPLAASISLEKSSKISTAKVFRYCGSMALNGHTLSIVANDAFYFESGTSIENGAIKIDKGILTLTDKVGSSTASLTLEAGTKIVGDFAYTVNDFAIDATASVEGPVLVYGTYKPLAIDAYMPTMQGGARLDLSGFSESFAIDSSKFAGSVTIDLGGRKLQKNQQILSWGSQPAYAPVFIGTDASFDADKFTITATGVTFDMSAETATSAVWKGTDGDFSKAENWIFKTATGGVTEVDQSKFDEIKSTLAVVISGDISGLTFDDTFPFVNVTFDAAFISADTTWAETFDVTKVSDSSNIDLSGKTLTFTVGETPFRAALTSSAANGAVKVIVPENVTFDNAGMNLTGSIKLVKDGEGTMIASLYPAEFENGTEVLAGTLKCNIDDMNKTDHKSLFGANNTVTLTGGVLDPAGSHLWGYQTVVLAGGKIRNTVVNTGLSSATSAATIDNDSQFNPILVLKQNAVLETTQSFNFRGTIQTENDAKLILKPASGKNLLWLPADADDAYVQVAGEGTFLVWGKGSVPDANQENLTFEVTESAKINMNTYSTSTKDYLGGMSVLNYIADSTSANVGAGALRVSGTFTPKTDHFFGATMLNGSAIDLSEKEEVWSPISADGEILKFADNATITIALGEREANIGDVLINWGEGKPANLGTLEFEVTGENIQEGAILVRDDEVGTISLASADKTVATAEWNGDAGENDFTDPKNWICKNADDIVITDGDPLPTADTVVKMPYTVFSTTQFPVEKQLVCKEIEFTGEIPESLTLKTNTDWRGLGAIDFPCAIDLNGFQLFLTLKNGTSAKELSVTGAGELHATVLEEATYTNTSVTFDGGLSFIKEGAGTFVAAVENQNYTGDTKVADGVLASGIENLKEATPFGAKKAVTVEANGALDPRGSYNWTTDFVVTLNGGMVSNTVKQVGTTTSAGASSTAYTAAGFGFPFDPTLNLSAESVFASSADFNFKGTVKGNSNKLIVKAADLRWASHDSGDATVEFVGLGHLRSLNKFGMNEPEMTLIMNNSKFDVGGDWVVSNYIAKASSAVASDGYRNASATLTVMGTFRPETSDFLGCVMQDGSTLDLTAQTKAFDLYNAQGQKHIDSVYTCQHVTFADDATVTIDVNGRELANDMQVVSWTDATKPDNLDTLKFKVDAETMKAGFASKLTRKSDGLYLIRSGLLLILK